MACSVTELDTTELDVVTFGELLAVVEPFDVGSDLASSPMLRKSIGGSEVNVALCLARLGHRVGWAGAVGDDPFGREGLHTLRGAGVDVSRVVVDRSAPTGMYFKEVLPLGGLHNHPYRTGSAASRLTLRDIDLGYLLSGRLLHLTGITAVISAAGHELISHLLDSAHPRGVHVSVDGNVRRGLLRGRDVQQVLAPLVQRADTLFLSTSEAMSLLGTDDPDQLRKQLPTLGATTVLLHDRHGAWAITADDICQVSAREVDVVDPTGAGDAFAAGYLSGWLDGSPMPERLRRAEQCAAYAVASRGDNPVYLPRSVRGPAGEEEGDSR
jgi:2-dehydro-3-deoxygluconokinase